MRAIPLRLAPFLLLLAATLVHAAEPPDRPLESATRKDVLNKLAERIVALYVFPEKGEAIARSLRERMERGKYDKITRSLELAEAVTRDLQEVSGDKHLQLSYGQEAAPPPEDPEARKARREAFFAELRTNNHFFEKVERLSGNVGYLDLRYFIDASLGGETAVAAMNFLADTDALIIDLRENHGGEPSMVAFLASYLFSANPVQLSGLEFREGGRSVQSWTLPYVPGRRYGEKKPVYLLTSGETFSAAEAFAYDLQSRGRAVLVGETTRGGAHFVEQIPLDDHFFVWLPLGRAVSPVTGTNWEGTGVKPDIAVPAAEAKTRAHEEALRRLRGVPK
ncbi:MAG TPA: S41 family peptidase [Thermoanaerobaculia bacterium]|nr:S41 family peptidase [Thermoanaerobaculia bacterium]